MIQRHIVVVVALVAAAVFTTAVHLFERRTVEVAATRAAEQAGAMVRPHSPIIGPADAPVTIVEFFDPACEACKAFHPQVKQILSSWPGQIRLVIRYAPFHRDASVEAVRVLEAARAQGKFESTLEVLLANQRAWSGQGVNSTARVWQLALSAGLDIEEARTHVASGLADSLLARDRVDLTAIGVRATPTFFVNGTPIASTDPDQLHESVKKELMRLKIDR